MIILRKYQPDDIAKIEDAVEPFTAEGTFRADNSLAITGVEDGHVMACGGLQLVKEGEGVVWVRLSKKCLTKPYRWARTIKETYRLMTESVGHITVTTYILSDFCKGDKLARWIGLKETGDTEVYLGRTYNKYTGVI